MADAEIEHDQISDDDLYDQATATEPVAEETELSRDKRGRFAAKEQSDQEPEAVEEEVAEEPEPERVDHRIPLTELLNEREKRQEAIRRAESLHAELEQLRRQMQPQQQPKKAPDQFADPEGYNQYWEQRLSERDQVWEQRFRDTVANTSLQNAHTRHGDVFEKAYESLLQEAQGGNRGPAQSVMNSPDPGEAMVRWYKRESTLRQVGDDPQAYLQKALDEALNNPEFLAKALEKAKGVAAANPTQVKLPPSLNKVAASRGDTDNDSSDAGMYRHSIGR